MVLFSVPATVVLVLAILPPLETAGDARVVLLCGTAAILVVSVMSDAVGVAVVAVVEICFDFVVIMVELIVGVATMVVAVAVMIGLLRGMDLVAVVASHPLHVLSHLSPTPSHKSLVNTR